MTTKLPLHRTRLRVPWAAWLAGMLAACGGAGVQRDTDNPGNLPRRDTRIVHAECAVDAAGAQRIDVNGDRRPDITIVRSGAAEACRAVDLNFDGKVDAWVYRDPSGQVTRRESDYDRDGRVDEISIYQSGVLVEKQRATTLAGKLDTWHFYQSGRLARTERDSDGDDVVDQWWEYPKPDKPDCPLIHSDVDGDGRPDPGATVDVCSEQASYVPPDRDQAAGSTGPSFERADPNAIPTEVEQKEEKKAVPAGKPPELK